MTIECIGATKGKLSKELNFAQNILDFIDEGESPDESRFRKRALEFSIPIWFTKENEELKANVSSLIEESKDTKDSPLDFRVFVSRIRTSGNEYLLVQQETYDGLSNYKLIRLVFRSKDRIEVSVDMSEEEVSVNDKFELMSKLLSI